jgi:hypothetical protein
MICPRALTYCSIQKVYAHFIGVCSFYWYMLILFPTPQCTGPSLQALTSNTFTGSLSVGGQSAGSIPFASGSLEPACTNSGAGEENNFGGSGVHCFDNINDDVEGNPNSWIMGGTAYNGKYFVGVRFPKTQNVRGIRISRDNLEGSNTDDRFSDSLNVYITRPGVVANPSFTTSSSLWQCIGVIPPHTAKTKFWYAFPTVYDASSVILEIPILRSIDQWQAVDELKVYGDVSNKNIHCCKHSLYLWVIYMFTLTLTLTIMFPTRKSKTIMSGLATSCS